MKYLPAFKRSNGLLTAVRSSRSAYDPDLGITDFAKCMNITLDDSGRPERCNGITQVDTMTDVTSAISHAGSMYLATATAIYSWIPGADPVGIRNNLTEGKVYFVSISSTLYYSNGVEKGKIVDGVSYVWECGEYFGPETKKNYSDPPAGKHLAEYNGRIYLAVDDTMYASEHLAPNAFVLNRVFKQYSSEITMIAPAHGCIYVGTLDGVYAEVGSSFLELAHRKVGSHGVIPGSLAYRDRDFDGSIYSTPYFTTEHGICIGGPGGTFTDITGTRVVMPSGLGSGAAGFLDQQYICALR